MSGFGSIGKKASEFLRSPKAQETLKSEKAEGISDKILDGAADVAKKVAGTKHHDKIDGARNTADKHIGNE